MQWLREHDPFNREEVHHQLRIMIETLPDFSFGRAGIRGQPRIDLFNLAGTNGVTDFIEIMDWMVQQWNASRLSQP